MMLWFNTELESQCVHQYSLLEVRVEAAVRTTSQRIISSNYCFYNTRQGQPEVSAENPQSAARVLPDKIRCIFGSTTGKKSCYLFLKDTTLSLPTVTGSDRQYELDLRAGQ